MSTGDSKKRKKNYYKTFAKKRRVGNLESDMTGFLVTFERSEFQAAKDCYELLNEYADKIWGPEKPEGAGSKESIEDDIAAELNELKESKDKVRRFQKVKTDVAGNFFVTTTVDDPGQLVTAIFEDLKAKHEQRSRFIQRLLPVQTTCKANLDTMKKTVETVLASYNDSASPEVAYLVAGKIRHNSSLQHNPMLQEIVQVVKAAKPQWIGELRKPDLVLMVDVLHNICCISLMPRYLEFRKYNLLEVTKPQPNSEVPKEPSCSADVPKSDSEESKDKKPECDKEAACEENKKPLDTVGDDERDVVEAADSKPDNASSNGGSTELLTNTSEGENVGSHKTAEASKD
ncbi:THUMP domain-containing protein 1 [Dermacentor andersoni]|uniref:THUMP domain-containing protein 1 n=1 Tax=Dermacentor andersoni TaxID=34620 RepID=UPI002155579A|nr:THUMP domain-containing protein 1-like [Dermacentor andersoni]